MNYFSNDVQTKKCIGQSDTSDRSMDSSETGMKKLDRMIDTDSIDSENFCFLYQEMNRCKKILEPYVQPFIPINCLFICGRRSKEDEFIALGKGNLLDKFILHLSYYSQDSSNSILTDIDIDSRSERFREGDIKAVCFFKVRNFVFIFLKTFSGDGRLLCVGKNCSDVAIIFEYIEDIYCSEKYCKTYVGYCVDFKKGWNEWDADYEFDSLLESCSDLEGVVQRYRHFEREW